MTDDMKLTVYASRDLSEAYGEMAQNLVDTVARGAFETLPADARKTLNDYDGGPRPLPSISSGRATVRGWLTSQSSSSAAELAFAFGTN
jgi:hypothetical protein